MARPSKAELLQRFFPELRQSGTAGSKEAAIRLSTLACEAILADWIRLFDLGLERDGPGLLALRLHRQAKDSSYLPLEALQQDRHQAQRDNAGELLTFLDEAITAVRNLNVNKAVAVLLVDNSGAQVFVVDRDHPARTLEAALQEFAQ